MIMLATSKVVKRKIYRVIIDKIDHRTLRRMIAECGGIEIRQKAGGMGKPRKRFSVASTLKAYRTGNLLC
jgi:hypothetical protein